MSWNRFDRLLVHDVYYDAIALAYTPGTINGVLSFYAYGGQANICVVDRMGHVVYTADHVWNRLDMLSRYDGPEKKQASADMDERRAGCVTLKTTAGESVYLAYRPIEDTPYMVVCEAACSLVQNVLRDYSALIARIVAAALAMLGLLAALLNVGIIRMADAMRKEAHAREKQLAQEKANCELASVNSTLRESICRAEMLREQMQREQEEKKHLYRNISRGIRTPLNVVVGLARLLTRTDDIETMKRYARTDERTNRTGDGRAERREKARGFGRLCQHATQKHGTAADGSARAAGRRQRDECGNHDSAVDRRGRRM